MYKDVEATTTDVILIIAQEPVFPCEHSIQGLISGKTKGRGGRQGSTKQKKQTQAAMHRP